jgi:hypothetical protein
MNQIRTRAFAALAGVLALGLAGCGRSNYAPVSGVVTLNGKPFRNAFVQFQPIATTDHPDPGRGSGGTTDENGHFTLKTVDGQAGAATGKHRVRISTRYSEKLHGYEVWDAAQNRMVKVAADPIPPEWNYDSNREFAVPAGGTDQANFDILTNRK